MSLQIGRQAHLGVVLALVAWGLLAAVVATAQVPAAQQERAAALRTLTTWSQREFTVPADVALDPPLRERVEALAREQQARAAALSARWVDEAAARPHHGPLMQLLSVRYVNEMVAWQVDRVSAADDARWLRMLGDPQLCTALAQDRTAFGRWATLLRRLPPEERAAAVADQAALLARWGQPRPGLPQRPGEPWVAAGRAALQRLRGAERPVGPPPAPPVLMWTLFVAKPEQLRFNERCALVTWMLQTAPLRDADAAEQARWSRFALAWDPAHDTPPLGRAETPADDYPPRARAFGLQGRVRVSGRVNAAGTGLEALRIERRELAVDGLGPARPVALDGLLDEASLRRAAAAPVPKDKAPGATVSTEFVWRLE